MLSKETQKVRYGAGAEVSAFSLVRLTPHDTDRSAAKGTTNQKSNTHANTATTVSRTRTKPSVIKTLFTYASILGPAPRSTVNTTAPFTLRLKFLRPTIMLPNHHLHPQTNLWHLTHVATVANNFRMILVLTGMPVQRILRMCTSSASAISQRNSSVQTTSVNISSTAMPAQAGNGPIFSNRLA